MLTQLLFAWCLMALCVTTHALGVTTVMRRFVPRTTTRFWAWTWTFIRLAGWMILIHLVEISFWALFYSWQGAIPDAASSLYFSAVTYTTTGYGDVILPKDWRLVGAVEALTGILMCGWTTGFFFAVVGRLAHLPER